MKNTLLSLVLSLSFTGLASAAAKTVPYEAVLHAELETLKSDRFIGASLELDGRKGLITLRLQPKMPPCPEGMMCTLQMPEPIEYVLENAGTTQLKNSCGTLRTVASYDQRPVDGIYMKVTIDNNRQNECDQAALTVNVEQAYYNRLQGGEVKTFDQFKADDFALIKPVAENNAFRGQLLKANYANKTLDLTLQYGGGCQEHAFDLNWGACKEVKLLNSTIQECDVTLIETQGAGDRCKALITKTHSIDFSGLAQSYVIKILGKRVLIH